jgi:hypothetical protein
MMKAGCWLGWEGEGRVDLLCFALLGLGAAAVGWGGAAAAVTRRNSGRRRGE